MEILTCYMDESADGDNKIAYSVAVVLGTKEKWAWLEKGWGNILQKYGLAYFSNKDCVAGTGPFAAMVDRSSRLAIRQELLEACRQSRIIAAGVTVDLTAFNAVVDTPAKRDTFGGTPHYYAATLIMTRFVQMVQADRPGDSLAFAFDKHEAYGDELLRVFKELKEKNLDLAPYLDSIVSLDDKSNIPIQVADLFASVVRRFGVSETPPPELAPLRDQGVLAEVRVCGAPCLEAHLRSAGLLS